MTLPLRLLATIRHWFRRARLVIFGAGFGFSCLLIAASGPDYVYAPSFPHNAYFSFLVLNPPLFALHWALDASVPLRGPVIPIVMFVLSAAWWLLLAMLFRRRSAPPHNTIVV